MEMEASALFVVASLRDVKAGFVGICYANRYQQTINKKADLSVGNPSRKHIEESVKDSIQITLKAISKLYRNDLV
jgi:uridine phosphorylase